DVVGEDEIGREMRRQRSGVERDVPVPLLARHLLQQDRLQTLVAIEHEHGEQRPDRRPDHLRAIEVETLRRGVLAEEDHVVASAAPLARDRPRIDVRPRTLEQVAVPEENAHGASLSAARPGGSTTRGAARPQDWTCAPARRWARPAAL